MNRPFRIKTPLGDDALLLSSFTGYERVSTPFRFVLELLSDDPNIDMKGLLIKPAVLSIKLDDETERHIHGIINRMKLVAYGDDGMAEYQAEMVPWLWFLTLYSNCRIFQNKSVPDIVEQVFKDRGFPRLRPETAGSYQPREYCVQYRETDFNFVSRLLEEEGIFYFFEQTEDKHTLVLADAKSAFRRLPHKKPRRLYARRSAAASMRTPYSASKKNTASTPERPRSPTTTSKSPTPASTPPSPAARGQTDETGEYYDYPGKYKTKDDGDRYVKIRLEEREVALVDRARQEQLHGL